MILEPSLTKTPLLVAVEAPVSLEVLCQVDHNKLFNARLGISTCLHCSRSKSVNLWVLGGFIAPPLNEAIILLSDSTRRILNGSGFRLGLGGNYYDTKKPVLLTHHNPRSVVTSWGDVLRVITQSSVGVLSTCWQAGTSPMVVVPTDWRP